MTNGCVFECTLKYISIKEVVSFWEHLEMLESKSKVFVLCWET